MEGWPSDPAIRLLVVGVTLICSASMGGGGGGSPPSGVGFDCVAFEMLGWW